MKFIKHLFLLSSLLFIAASCSSDSDQTLPSPGAVDPNFKIIPSSGLGHISAQSRAAVSPKEGTDLAVSVFRVDQTAVDTYPSAFTAVSNPAAATLIGDTRPDGDGTEDAKADAVINLTVPQHFLSNGWKTKVLSVYPAVAASNWTAASNQLAYTIDGKTDIMATAWGEGYKKLSENPATAVQPTGMVFNHLLTQIRVKVYADGEISRAYWGKIKSVSVTGRATGCTLALPAIDGTAYPVLTAGSTTGAFTLFNASDAAASLDVVPTSSTNAVEFGYSLFAPVTTKAVLPLTVVTETGTGADAVETTTDIIVPERTYLAGTKYIITLKLTSLGIVPEGVAISEWNEIALDEDIAI